MIFSENIENPEKHSTFLIGSLPCAQARVKNLD